MVVSKKMINLRINENVIHFKKYIEEVHEILVRFLSLRGYELKVIPYEKPKKEEYGDFSTPLPKILISKFKLDEEELIKKLENLQFGEKYEINYINGYLNFKIKKEYLLKDFVAELGNNFNSLKIKEKKKALVEHTSVNPNKAMHIGHIRNSILGDIVQRFLKFIGYKVEVQNYIDDTGNQVADSYLASKIFKEEFEDRIKKEDLEDVLWDLYPKINKLYEKNKELLEKRNEIIKKIEEGDNEVYREVREMVKEIVKQHTKLLNKLNIFFDVAICESTLIQEKLWDLVFDYLKKSGKLVYEKEGKYKGCWVLKLSDLEEFRGLKDADKVLVRSNGTLTYTAKDIAYAFWKFGIVDKKFKYIELMKQDGKPLYFSDEKGEEMEFGKANLVINVIDIRQSYPQKVVKYSFKLLGLEDMFKNYIHLGYEVVALSKKTLEKLGIKVEEEKEFYHMSGRKGIGVKAKDLYNLVYNELSKKIKDRKIENIEEVLKALTIAAIRFEMAKLDLDKVLVFDIDEAINFEGKSGVYLLYTYVRAINILKKLNEKPEVPRKANVVLTNKYEEILISKMFEFLSIVEEIKKDLRKINKLINYTYELAKIFNEFYHNSPIIQENNENIRNSRITLLKTFLVFYRMLLEDILGFRLIERM